MKKIVIVNKQEATALDEKDTSFLKVIDWLDAD